MHLLVHELAPPCPLAALDALNPPEAALLQSAEIESKAGQKSLLLLRPSLRLSCRGQAVTAQALTPLGEAQRARLAGEFGVPDAERLVLTFSPPPLDTDEEARLRSLGNLDPLRALSAWGFDHPEANAAFLAGVFAYDLLDTFEALPPVPPGGPVPDYLFYLSELLLEIDHVHGAARLLLVYPEGGEDAARRELEELAARLSGLEPYRPPAAPALGPARTNVSDPAFAARVTALQEHIAAGDIYQAVPSRKFTVPCADALAAYARLAVQNPSPYMFFLRATDFELFGASPESALRHTASTGHTELHPIAGTRPRGREHGEIDPELDSRTALELLGDPKERSEHLMLLDLARNDLARVCVPGTRHVAQLMGLDRYSQVMHLVSRVAGTLRPGLDALHAYRACMNMGTLVGAPKLRAAALLREQEGERRGAYGGAAGYLNGHGDLDTCVVIRAALVSEGQATVQAGAGVVQGSDPAAEANETRHKARAALLALGGTA